MTTINLASQQCLDGTICLDFAGSGFVSHGCYQLLLLVTTLALLREAVSRWVRWASLGWSNVVHPAGVAIPKVRRGTPVSERTQNERRIIHRGTQRYLYERLGIYSACVCTPDELGSYMLLLYLWGVSAIIPTAGTEESCTHDCAGRR